MRIRTALLVLSLIWSLTTSIAGQEVPVEGTALLEQRVQSLEAQLKAMHQGKVYPAQASSSALPGMPAICKVEEPKTFPTYKINGAINADAGWFNQTEANRIQVGDLQDGAAFRRARLGVSGLVSENIGYFLQMDFAFPGRPTFTDVYLDIVEVPGAGNVRFGQWKQPYSIEIISSFKYNPWLERSPIFLLSPFRRIGIGFYDHSDNDLFTWAMSVVKPGNDQYGGDLGDDGGVGAVGRLTTAPIFEGDSERVLHLGAAFYVAEPSNNQFRIGAFGGNAPEFALIQGTTVQPSMVDTGVMATNWYNSVQSEAALIWGPFSIQAEGAYSYLTRPDGRSPLNFCAGYVGATYFLTGEHRQYDPKKATFGAIKVNNEYNPCKNGLCLGGAWELTARLSYIDGSDQDINGGVLTDVTAGVNWWLNSNTRFTFNFIHTWLDKQPTGQSEASIFAVRAQVDF